MNQRIQASPDILASFCSKWKIVELSFFGILAHKYADIELRVIWEAATNELANVLPKIEMLLEPFEKQ